MVTCQTHSQLTQDVRPVFEHYRLFACLFLSFRLMESYSMYALHVWPFYIVCVRPLLVVCCGNLFILIAESYSFV